MLRLSHKRGQKSQVRGVEGGYTSLTLINHTKAAKGAVGKGTYILTASFKGDEVRKRNLVQVGVSQNAGPSGVFTGLDLRECDDGYSFTGEYAGAEGPSVYVNAYTQPQVGEQGVSASELRKAGTEFNFIVSAADARLRIAKAFLPPVPASPEPPTSPRC
jgi:hypothetical protein